MENLFEQISNDIKTAKGSDGTLHDEQAVKIMQKMLKQRKESAQIYSEQNRPELAEKELAEAEVIERYLPQPMGDSELETILTEIISQTGASGPQDMGKVMGAATKLLAGKADGRAVSEKVKSLLNR